MANRAKTRRGPKPKFRDVACPNRRCRLVGKKGGAARRQESSCRMSNRMLKPVYNCYIVSSAEIARSFGGR